MSVDNIAHVPLFEILENGDLTVYISVNNQSHCQPLLWVLKETSEDRILFTNSGSNLEMIEANSLQSLPPYLNIYCEGKVCKYYINAPSSNTDFRNIEYKKNHDHNKIDENMNNRNTYILSISQGTENKLDKLGFLTRDGSTVTGYIWKPPRNCDLERDIEFEPEIHEDEMIPYSVNFPPILICNSKYIYLFDLKRSGSNKYSTRIIYKTSSKKELCNTEEIEALQVLSSNLEEKKTEEALEENMTEEDKAIHVLSKLKQNTNYV